MTVIVTPRRQQYKNVCPYNSTGNYGRVMVAGAYFCIVFGTYVPEKRVLKISYFKSLKFSKSAEIHNTKCDV